MSRKTKPGIDYFSHDVDTTSDLKIKILIAKYGLLGYAVYLRLLEEVYRGSGYYLQISEDFNILFANDSNLDLNVYIETLNVCIEKDLFSKKLYEKYLILTSRRIQKNYFAGTERRKEVEFISEYLIENPRDFYNLEKVNVCINQLNVDIKPLNDDAGTQSKVKESKVEERILLVVDYLNRKLGTKFKATASKTITCITARLNEGYTGDDFKTVIDKKYSEWNGTEHAKFLRPETLFGNKFDGYLNQIKTNKPSKKHGNYTDDFWEQQFNGGDQTQPLITNQQPQRKAD